MSLTSETHFVVKRAIDRTLPGMSAKRIARELECSIATAKRTAASGRASGRLRPALLRMLIRLFEQNEAEAGKLRDALKAMASEEMVARAEIRRAPNVGARVAVDDSKSRRPAQPVLNLGDD